MATEGFTWNRKRIESDADDARARGQGGAYVGLKDGESLTGRFLPVEVPKPGAEAELYVRYGQHYLRDIETYLTCLDELVVCDYVPKDWRCPLCALWRELRGSKDADDQEAARRYNVSMRFMSNIRLESGDVRIFRYSSKTQPKLVDLVFGTEYPDLLDLVDGRDVEIKRKGAKLDTDYLITPKRKTYTVDAGVLDQLHDIYGEIKVLEPKKMEEILKGADVDDDAYISLRLMMKGPGPAARSNGGVAGSSPIVRRRAEPVKQPDVKQSEAEAADTKRLATRAEAKLLKAFGDELGLDVDPEYPYAVIIEALVTEAVGASTKGMSEDLSAWLEANGCNVEGKKVERAAVPAAKSDELSEVERQIQNVRDARAKRK